MSDIKAYTHLIWDFNGTVLDDVALSIQSINRMLEKRGLPVIPSVAAYRESLRFPIIEHYRDRGFDFEREDYYTVLAPEWVSNYMEGEHSCGMNPGVKEALDTLAERGVSQIMLSASQRDMLRDQLERLGITGYFSEILGQDNIYAKSKTELALAWRARNPQARPLFVGDTHHDAEVAEAIGADCVLYTRGHQSKERLSVYGKPLIDAITDIIGYFS